MIHIFLFLQTASTTVALGPAGKIIAIAATVSLLIQGIKKALPGLDGKEALAINVIGALSASLALSNVGDFKTPAFWIQVITTVVGAAGVHDLGNFTKLFKQNGVK